MRLCIPKGPTLRNAGGGKWRRVDLAKTVCGRMTRTDFLHIGVRVVAVAVIKVRGHEYATPKPWRGTATAKGRWR
jgi:hypothetical protein